MVSTMLKKYCFCCNLFSRGQEIVMAIVKVMYWQDIPCSVRAQLGRRDRVTRKLPDIYLAVIDAVAMKDGLVDADDYQAAFRWSEPEERDGSPEEVADAVVAEVLAKYPKAWLIERGKQAGADLNEI
jgi:hypothetical protein